MGLSSLFECRALRGEGVGDPGLCEGTVCRGKGRGKRGNQWPAGRIGQVEVEESGPQPRGPEPQPPELAY